MRRRQFLAALGAASLGTQAATRRGTARRTSGVRYATASTGQIPDLEFDSTASLLDAGSGPLTDAAVVAVWAEDTATNHDDDGNGDATLYGEDTAIPLVATDSNVVGFGAMLVTDDVSFQRGNEEFVLNVWDDALGGSGTVLWDEGHGQFYVLSKFSAFEGYAEDSGYAVQATTSLASDLSGADAAVITSPDTAFTQPELNALGDFVAGGGWLFLHDQSDFSNHDATANLNDVAAQLNLAFRFNDDEVVDGIQNGGNDYQPTTAQFNTSFPFFADRPGLGLDPETTYTVDVTRIIDGDTVEVTFADGSTENIRTLGMDTPETDANDQFERLQEWEGIEDEVYLDTWGANASDFATRELNGKTVDLHFDDEEPVRDVFDRVLGYLSYDATGDGTRGTIYNREAVRQGQARVYDSGFTKHDSFIDAEQAAKTDDRGVWQQSDPANSSEIRNRAVGDLFFPTAASVRTAGGAIADSRVPVFAESTASQDLDGGVSYSEVPLVGVDETAGVAVVGGPVVDEEYESAEGFAVDTASFENFVFLTNLVDYLSSNSGDVLIDGGHGQFNATFGLSAEDAAYYMRFLEGQDIGFEGVNAITTDNLSGARALLVTTPPQSFTTAETDAVSTYLGNGGAVVLLGGGKVTAGARSNLNALAADIGTDLRVNEDLVLDSTNNVNSDAEIPTTTVFDTSFPLFDAYGDGSTAPPDVAVVTVNEDGATLNDEYVDFENVDSVDADMTGWTVEDEAAHTYTFPDGFTLSPGETVRLHTGSGTDTSTDLYWGSGSAVWNNSGDTVFLYDDGGTLVDEHTYPTGELAVAQIHEDAAGDDSTNLNDEYVVFENVGEASLDLTGWTVEDEAGKTYQFPDSFSLAAGDQVTLHSGSGTDTSTDLYWGQSGSAVWNNSGDTVFVFDDAGTKVIEESYTDGGTGPDVDVAQVNEDGATLNDEYVVFENLGSSGVDMTGWTVEDEAAHTYQFPDGFTLGGGDQVTLHTGSGTDTSTDLYWGSGSPIWNNSGDTVFLYDDGGTLVEEHSY